MPLREVVRIHASSGTTGASTVVGYSRNDIRTWSNLVARVITAGGVTAWQDLALLVSIPVLLMPSILSLAFPEEPARAVPLQRAG